MMIEKKATRFWMHKPFIWVAVIFLISCGANPALMQNKRLLPDSETVTYSGKIPCADCAGQRIVLTLFPDSTFRLRQTYLGVLNDQDKDFYDLGRWVVENGSDRLKLYGGTKKLWQFRFQTANRLRMLDIKGDEIHSNLNYELTRLQEIDLVEGPMFLGGMYMYMADAAVFKECLTEKSYPVLIEADHLALERAYLSMRHHPGETMLVTFKGRFVQRMPEPGLPVREHLIVEQFHRILPGKTCTEIRADTSLLETHILPLPLGEGQGGAE